MKRAGFSLTAWTQCVPRECGIEPGDRYRSHLLDFEDRGTMLIRI
jgi:hypothetical protein